MKNNIQILEQPRIDEECIVDKTIQRLCAKLDTPIVILDNIIYEIPFDIDYYPKPKKLENINVERHQDSFILSWDNPQNKAYKYHIYNSQEIINNNIIYYLSFFTKKVKKSFRCCPYTFLKVL